MNMFTSEAAAKTSYLLKAIAQPFRLKLLAVLEEGEACVCHLEMLLGKRQAYISQHLMTLREAGLLDARRDGKYVYYRLKNARILDLVCQAASIAGISIPGPGNLLKNLPACECPNCAADESPLDVQVVR